MYKYKISKFSYDNAEDFRTKTISRRFLRKQASENLKANGGLYCAT